MNRYPVLSRVLAVFLALGTALPGPAWALRPSQPETPDQKAGLEEDMKSGQGQPGDPPARTDWTPFWDDGWVSSVVVSYEGELREVWERFFWDLSRRAPQARILDIGTGNLAIPKIAKEIHPGFDLHGIDPADIKPDRISSSYGIQFRRAVAERTGYPGGYFDGVTGMFGLEYSDTELSIPEMARVLRPGGRGMLILHHAESRYADFSRRSAADNGILSSVLRLFETAQESLRDPSSDGQTDLQKAVEDLKRRFSGELGEDVRIASEVLRDAEEMGADSPEVALEYLEREKEKIRFLIAGSKDLVRAAVSLEQAPGWTDRLARAGLAVDRFEPLVDSKGVLGWKLEFHNPLPAGLEEEHSYKFALNPLQTVDGLQGAFLIFNDQVRYFRSMDDRVFHVSGSMTEGFRFANLVEDEVFRHMLLSLSNITASLTETFPSEDALRIAQTGAVVRLDPSINVRLEYRPETVRVTINGYPAYVVSRADALRSQRLFEGGNWDPRLDPFMAYSAVSAMLFLDDDLRTAMRRRNIAPVDILRLSPDDLRASGQAGLEEGAGRALDLLAEATVEDGVVVIGPDALEANAGLEELVKRSPPALARRMVLFGVGAAVLARVRAANPAVRVVESGEVADLAAFLLALPEAERVTVLGAALLADQLRQILPVSVNLLERAAALRFILAAAGVSGPALDRVDLDRLRQFLAQRQSA